MAAIDDKSQAGPGSLLNNEKINPFLEGDWIDKELS